jgi:putative ABC transport system permease protein
MSPAFRIARRELRGGLKGFRVFLACLALGVAAIAAVGSVRVSIEQGLSREGATLLGGDAQMTFTYRDAGDEERAWMERTALAVSEVVDFRSMATVNTDSGDERALTQVKGVDDRYPLTGEVVLDPPIALAQALAPDAGNPGGGLPGGVMERALADRLGIVPGDTFRLGTQDFRLTALLLREPDAAGEGFGLGPRTIVRAEALAESQLLGAGTLFETKYRLLLPPEREVSSVAAEAQRLFRDRGMRWRDSRNAAPGVSRFVERLAAFLVLVGLAGLAVGGVGVSAAVRAYLDRKVAVIATLKTLGAEGRTIFAAYFLQVGALGAVGIGLGVLIGAALPLAFAPLLEARLPLPVDVRIHPRPLAEAALYGVLTALLFTLWPLARTEQVRAAALFRDATGPQRGLPRTRYLVLTAAILALLVGMAAWLSGVPWLAVWAATGVGGALVLLVLAAAGARRLARRAARAQVMRGRTPLRLALGSVGGPGNEATSVVLSLGLGLSVLAAVGQIDWNLRNAIATELPEVAPSYFVVDIQPDQIEGFRARLDDDPGVSKVETAPMLRGVLTGINGRPAREVAGDHWVVRGDRGITYAATPPPDTRITAGTWWPEDYDGPPQVSFAEEEAAEIGLRLGDEVTVNILGRDITAEITSFRVVDFSTAGIGFIMLLNPAALQGAPHSFIATIHADEAAEAAILRDLATAYPNITAIRVKDAIERVADILGSIAAAITYGAGVTLVTGVIVLIGAAAAGEAARVFESAILKTVGATRGQILAYFALRSAMLGAVAGVVAIAAGGIAGWAVMRFVMEATFRFEPVSAVAIVVGGALATLAAGLGFAWRPLAARPARVLRGRE